ncbi:leucine-rich repeat extensin-like protein 3 [Miscanthus floridulus]|uniref:leucine-rich repeat extensin-like protein 3 n=1 Tax=Miscanthus floridulus TaxID=154761 RepID=UPI003459FD8A
MAGGLYCLPRLISGYICDPRPRPPPPCPCPAPVLLSPEPLLRPPSSSALGPVPGTLAPATELLYGHRTRPPPPSSSPVPMPRPVFLSPKPLRWPPSSSALGPVPGTLAPATELLHSHCPHSGPHPPPWSPSPSSSPITVHTLGLVLGAQTGSSRYLLTWNLLRPGQGKNYVPAN